MCTVMDLKKITLTLIMFVLLPLSVNAQTLADDEDDILLMIPPILAASATPVEVIPPVWTVVNEVCCSIGSATYSATVDGQTRGSTLSSCLAIEPSVPEVVVSTAGTKSVRSELNAASCGRLSFPRLEFPFEDSNLYVFQAVFNSSTGGVEVNVLTAALTPANRKAMSDVVQMKRLMTSGKTKLLLSKSVSIESAGRVNRKSEGDAQGSFQSVQQ